MLCHDGYDTAGMRGLRTRLRRPEAMTMSASYLVLPERVMVKLSGQLGLEDWQTLRRARHASIVGHQLLEIDIRDIDRRSVVGVAMHINSRDDAGMLPKVSIVGCDHEAAAILNWERVCTKCATGMGEPPSCAECPTRHSSARRLRREP